MDTFLAAAARTHPCSSGDTGHGLHTLLAIHSWKHHRAITLHPLDHNPHQWTPEDDATIAITIQQGYHPTWSDPAPHPPASPTLQDVFATISAELQEAKAPQQPDDEMPQAPPPQTAQERPPQESLTHLITKMELPPQHLTTPDGNGSRDLRREWAIHNGTLRWDEITPGLQAIRLHSITEPTNTRALPADRHHLLLTIQGDAAITPTEVDLITAAPAHAVHIPPQTSSAPMTVHWSHPIASRRHHLPRPQRPHTRLATKVGGHPWGPPRGTPSTHVHPPHPPPGARSGPRARRHTHPGVMGARNTHEPTSSGGY